MNDAKSSTATATTATADPTAPQRYTGRFAPSPSGDLHLGSLYAAAASYLDARAHGGEWLVRVEDLDAPRVMAGSARRILQTLERFGFEWDGEVVYQSSRTDRYRSALQQLEARGLTFDCSCSRSQLSFDERYPGLCRAGPRVAGVPTAIRLRIEPGHVQFTDQIQGTFRQDVAAAVGDVVLRRRDQLFAYVLAVVVDDDAQGVTHIVRGADLLDNTPRQMVLQQLLGLHRPNYAHVPVIIEADGSKLAKSARSMRADAADVLPQLLHLFRLLHLAPPPELHGAAVHELWQWAIDRWDVAAVPKRLTMPLDG